MESRVIPRTRRSEVQGRPVKRQRREDDREDGEQDEYEDLVRSGVWDDEECGDNGGEDERGRSSGNGRGEGLGRSSGSGGGRGVVEPDVEGRPVRTATPPYVPSAKERRDHDATHYPPGSWCRYCVEGRGIASPHGRNAEEKIGDVGELHLDYCFIHGKPGAESATTIVGVDKYSHAVLAHVVPKRGTEFEWAAKQLDRDAKKFGDYGR